MYMAYSHYSLHIYKFIHYEKETTATRHFLFIGNCNHPCTGIPNTIHSPKYISQDDSINISL